MVTTVCKPGDVTLEGNLAGLEHTDVEAEACNCTEVLVEVVSGAFAAQDCNDVASHELALTNSVLCVRNAVTAYTATRKVGACGCVSSTPGAFDNSVVALNTEVCTNAQTATLVKGEVGCTEHGVSHDTSGPDDEVRLELLTGGELDESVLCRLKLGVEVNLSTTLCEVVEHPLAGLEGNLGHDAAHCLDEVEVSVLEGQLWVVLDEVRSERAKLCEDLNTCEATTNNGDGEQTVTLRTCRKLSCLVEVRKNAVADRNCFFDGLQTDCIVCNAGNGEGARNSTSSEDDLVILLCKFLARVGNDGCSLLLVVNASNLARDDAGLLEV